MSTSEYYKGLANDANEEECKIIFKLIEKAAKRGLYHIEIDSKTVELTPSKEIYLRQLNFYVSSGSGKHFISWQN